MNFLSFISLLSLLLFSNDWGQTGHRVVGEVATYHLSDSARQAVEELLDGASLASGSNYADWIRSDRNYDKYRTWHYVNYPFDQEYEASEKNPDGDVVQALRKCIAVLDDPKETKASKAFYLKLLVHFIGDIHQPMHVWRMEDRGGNEIRVKWFGKSSNLHRVWDSQMIDDFQMSFTELANDLPELSQAEIEEIQGQPLLDWVEETHAKAQDIFENTTPNSSLGYFYRYQYFDMVKKQLCLAGLRLAATLNELFK